VLSIAPRSRESSWKISRCALLPSKEPLKRIRNDESAKASPKAGASEPGTQIGRAARRVLETNLDGEDRRDSPASSSTGSRRRVCATDRSRRGKGTAARVARRAREASVSMPSRNLSRRLERLEAELAPPSDEPALTITVTSPGKPDWIIEVHGTEPTGRRRPWQRNGGRER
jgi:hypothetical protein